MIYSGFLVYLFLETNIVEHQNMLSEDRHDALQKRMESLGIKEDDLIEKFILGSGKGGQKINKTSSCVYIKHIPTGIEIKCQEGRSREMNRLAARRQLCDRIEGKKEKIRAERQQLTEKIRRQKRRRTKGMQEKNLANKRHHSEKKGLRKRPDPSH